MKTEQPEALRLAAIFEDELKWQTTPISRTETAAELRRLHSLNQELLEALKDAAHCVQENYLPDMCGHDWDALIAKAKEQE